MSKVDIPPMSPNSDNPRLNTNMGALLAKLSDMKLLATEEFRYHLIITLIDRWFRASPRELFRIMMLTEFKWRLSLYASHGEENQAMIDAAKANIRPADRAGGGQ